MISYRNKTRLNNLTKDSERFIRTYYNGSMRHLSLLCNFIGQSIDLVDKIIINYQLSYIALIYALHQSSVNILYLMINCKFISFIIVLLE